PLADRLHDLGARMVGIKCGKLGFFLSTGSADQMASLGAGAPADPDAWAKRCFFCETFVPDQILSTTGSGDSSIAGFLAGLLTGRSPEQTLKLACAAGANTARVYDTTSGVETVAQMEAKIAGGWNRNRLDYRGSIWRFDANRVIWSSQAPSSSSMMESSSAS
ncbi:MAG: carbohydrate kinase family protein, partial [Spirochaetaceae bacterium]